MEITLLHGSRISVVSWDGALEKSLRGLTGFKAAQLMYEGHVDSCEESLMAQSPGTLLLSGKNFKVRPAREVLDSPVKALLIELKPAPSCPMWVQYFSANIKTNFVTR